MRSIPEQPAFYKKVTEPSDFWSTALEKVENANYTLLIENHEEYTYPVDGWYYHATPPQDFIEWYNANFLDDVE